MRRTYLAAAVFSASLLTACGGAGEGTGDGNPTAGGGTNPTDQGQQPTKPTQPTDPTDPVVVSKNLSGQITGFSGGDQAFVTLSGGGELHTTRMNEQGGYQFEGLTPGVNYSVKVQAPGYSQTASVTTTTGNSNADVAVSVVPNPDGDHVYRYTWEDDGESVSGLEYASAINQPLAVEIEGLEKQVPNIAAAQMLYRDYRVVLDDSGDIAWTQAHAYRLLETLRQVPQKHCDTDVTNNGSELELPCNPKDLKDTSWKLSNGEVDQFIAVDGQQVTLDTDAFTYANPLIANVDGRRGRFYSKSLHHAVVNYITKGGSDLVKANFILENRFGVTIDTRGNGRFSNLNSAYRNHAVIAEDREASAWQSFTPEEILIVINQLEEMPQGLHVIRDKNDANRGLKYLFRRANAHDHPLYPDAPAVAWPTAGYIEFMEKAFKGSNFEHMQRLVLHEKAHFLWHYVVTREMKLEWLQLSQWYRVDGDDSEAKLTELLQQNPYSTVVDNTAHTHGSEYQIDRDNITVDASDGWSARKTTNFVSGYAQLKNPNEDLAESVSYFLINPDKLRSRAPAKYEFIRDRLMAGVTYLQAIRDDLTFEVLNLHPDYIYPGKIKKVDITVKGAADKDKQITVDLQLHTTGENCKLDSCLEGASRAFTRLFSDADTFKDIYFYPVSASGSRRSVSDRLRATFTLANTVKNGWWAPAQITVSDPTGNERYQRSTDYGWQLYINNPGEDTVAPEYVANSLTLDLSDERLVRVSNGQVSGNCTDVSAANCRAVRVMTAEWDVDEDVKMADSSACFARFAHQSYSSYSEDVYGNFRENVNGDIDGQCKITMYTTEYHRHGQYRVGHVSMRDRALNRNSENFSDNHSTREASPKVNLNDSANPDSVAPEMSIANCNAPQEGRCISISAVPVNADKPNGETRVTIKYWARDDKSGLGTVAYNLRDPQGKDHFYYASHANTHTLFFHGDPAAWTSYTETVVLPAGSAPGTWGLANMVLHDKAGNRKTYDFTETLIFEPFEVQ